MTKKQQLIQVLVNQINVDKQLKIKGSIYTNKNVLDKINSEFSKQIKVVAGKSRIDLYDATYLALTDKAINDLLKEFNKFKYKNEQFDCDDFSKVFIAFSILSFNDEEYNAGLGVGLLSFTYTDVNGKNGGHAINIVLVDDNGLKIKVIEPQTAKLYNFDAYCKLYAFKDPELMLILI